MDFETAATLKPRPLVDPFARAITYLRVSVTDRCDFRCVYCMAENMVFLPKQDLLSLEELDRLCSAFVAKGVRKLRLTGGEPLVRRGIMTLVGSLARSSPLAPGESYDATLNVTLPQVADSDAARIFVVIDALNQVWEQQRESDNTASAPVAVRHVDLRADTVTAPASAQSGDTIHVSGNTPTPKTSAAQSPRRSPSSSGSCGGSRPAGSASPPSSCSPSGSTTPTPTCSATPG